MLHIHLQLVMTKNNGDLVVSETQISNRQSIFYFAYVLGRRILKKKKPIYSSLPNHFLCCFFLFRWPCLVVKEVLEELIFKWNHCKSHSSFTHSHSLDLNFYQVVLIQVQQGPHLEIFNKDYTVFFFLPKSPIVHWYHFPLGHLRLKPVSLLTDFPGIGFHWNSLPCLSVYHVRDSPFFKLYIFLY